MDQKDLLEQLQKLRAEKELLEKHVFVLNDCLSVEELKSKISNLEKKKEMLISLENVMERLRAEIEPIKYLKSILEKKLEVENQTNKIESSNYKILQSQDIQNIITTSNKTESILSQTCFNELSNKIETPINSNSVSIINEGSIDECMQLLDQYDIVTDQDMLHFSENHLKTQCNNEEPSITIIDELDDGIQDKQIASTSMHLDTEGTNMQLKEEHLSKKGLMETSGVNNLVNFEPPNSDIHSNQLHEASTSGLCQNKNNICLDSNIGDNISDLLLKFPQMLLQQEIASMKVEGNSNETLNNNNANNYKSDTENNLKTLKKEIGQFINGSEKLLLNSAHTFVKNAMNCDFTKQTKPNQCNKLHNDDKSEINIISFNDMNLKIDILRGIYSLGFVNPTTLQQRVIVHCINGRDVIVFAGPGNGRTMMFTIPLLQQIKTDFSECQALVLVPTRDIAVHIQKIIMSVGDFLNVSVCIGGDNVPKKLSLVPHVIVGTPAGVFNMIACKSLQTGCIKTVVLNQADKMLTPNYTKFIKQIMEKLVKDKQITLLTSDKLDHILDMYMDSLRDPLVIIDDDNREKKMIKNLPKQFYLNIQEDWKINALCEINEILKIQQAVIFCNSLDRAQNLYKSLQQLEYSVSLFHLEMSAYERQQKLDMFSSNKLRIFITTDPIKGSQFQQAAWLINYDLPVNPICYLDRVAKCAENIKVLNLINENDDITKIAIETYNKSYMIQMPLNMVDLLQY